MEVQLGHYGQERIDPEIYASIFETDEALAVQEKVAQARGAVSALMQKTGLVLVRSASFDLPTEAAIATKYKVWLPRDVFHKYDEPYVTGASQIDGQVNGMIRMKLDPAEDFNVSFSGTRSGGNSSGRFETAIPSSAETNRIPARPVSKNKARLTILGLAAAAEYARSWNLDEAFQEV